MPVVGTQVAASPLVNVANSVGAVGTSLKVFAVAHPVSLSILGGTLLGYSACNRYKKYKAKKQKKSIAIDTSSTTTA